MYYKKGKRGEAHHNKNVVESVNAFSPSLILFYYYFRM